MKILVFSPYLYPCHYGGGEKYLFDIAKGLALENHKVKIGVPARDDLNKEDLISLKQSYENFLGKSLAEVEFIFTPLWTQHNFVKKLWWTRQFDAIFYLSDGSFFFSLAKKNIVHIQFPLKIDHSSFINQLKLKNWGCKTTNSEFTKKIIEPSWPVKVDLVHQPMVDVDLFGRDLNFAKKEKNILNVGRFFSHLHAKRQDILVEIFAKMRQQDPETTKDWQLVLIGNVEDEEYAKKVHQAAKNLPIKIIHQCDRQSLINWFQRSSIYWHATGYRINEEEEPQKVEHFGITTVEAMAAGNVPIVIGKGGQQEVVGEELQDWTWLTQADCMKNTLLMLRNQNLREKIQKMAQKRAQNFGPEVFQKKIKKMLEIV